MTARVVAFRAGAVAAAARTEEVDRILARQELLPAPDAPDFILGLLPLEGKVLAVVDVARRIFPGLPAPEEARHLLQGRFGGVPAVLAVTEVEGIVPVEEERPAEEGGLPPAVEGLLAGVVTAGGERRVLLDLSALLGRERPAVERASRDAAGTTPSES